MKKIAVYFPGIGYHCDKPLLYYSRNAAYELGYENYKNVAYTYKAGNIRGNEAKIKEAYEALTEQEILDKLEKSREHAAQGMYKNAAEVSRDMRAKYGL